LIDFSVISRSTLWGKVLRLPLRAIPPDVALPILQGALLGRRWVVSSSVPGCWLGYYESKKQRRFSATVRPGDVVFDVGANAGFYTLLAALRSTPAGQVIAFEPLPQNARYVNQHIQLNRLTNVRVIEAAVGDFVGQGRFAVHQKNAEGRLSADGEMNVRVVSLDQLRADGEIPVPNVMKIDVEGGELAVLQGARRLLTQAHPTIFLATHGDAVHHQCCALLRSIGYRVEPLGSADSVETTDELVASWQAPIALEVCG
jgi:FkbM family methyltransferase